MIDLLRNSTTDSVGPGETAHNMATRTFVNGVFLRFGTAPFAAMFAVGWLPSHVVVKGIQLVC